MSLFIVSLRSPERTAANPGPLKLTDIRPELVPTEVLDRLRASLPSWRARSALPPEATVIVRELCTAARAAGWTPEQLVVAVKNTFYSSNEVKLDTTSERDALLARVVTSCIKEFFREGDPAQ